MERYKVWLLNEKNKVEKVIVFNGDQEEEMGIFSEELGEDPIFSPVLIHKDDSIGQVKQKILNELGCILSTYASENCESVTSNYDELYLFAYKTRTINFLNAITTSTKSVINQKIFAQFANGFREKMDANKEIYEYKYLSSLGEKTLSVKTGLGMEFKNGYNYLFSADPFLNDPTVENDKIKNSIYLNENKLLGSIDDNNIYVCLAKDVFKYAEKKGFSTDSFSSIYFPHLATANIFGSADLMDAQEELKEKTDKMMTEKDFASYQIIDTLYENSEPLPNEKHGINRFDIEIVPSYKLVMPLDAIFKNIHCDAEFPFIKYNPGVRRENIYRLYSTAVSKTGKQIPYLPKKKIDSLMRTTSNHKQISIYNLTHRLIISIESDGAVKIVGEFKEYDVKTMEEIEAIIKSSVNPVIEKVNHYLRTSGYNISTIASLKDENVKIVNMNYQYSIKLAKKFVDVRSNNNAFVLNNMQYQVKEGIYTVESFVEEMAKQIEPDGFSVTYDEQLTITHGETEFTLDVSKKNALNVIGIDKAKVLKSTNLSLKLPKSVLKTANMNLKNTCVYPVFWVEKSNVAKEAVLRFVRVDNFQKMNSLASFISDMYKKRGKEEDAYNALVVQHEIELNQAKKLVAKILSDTDIVSANPGLLTTMKLENDVLKVSVNNLTSIDYIETLRIYLSSIVKITQEMVDVSDKCGTKEEKKDKKEEEEEEAEIDVAKQIELLIGNKPKSEIEDSDSDSSVLPVHDFEFGDSSDEIAGGSSSDSSDDESAKGKKYFLKRLTKSDPVLFKEVNKKDGKIGRYTRTCQSVQQPVVISNEEKEHIDKNYKGSYNEALEYGSSKDKKNWYICPQFWCFKTNTPMSQQDIDAGKCGDAKEQKKNVFEFTNKRHKNQDGSYRHYNPGFITNHHPNKDLCLPCCYAEWDSKMHKDRRDKCKENIEKEENEGKEKKGKKGKTEEKEKKEKREKKEEEGKKEEEEDEEEKENPNQGTDIMGNNTILTPKRWGYLPIAVARFMQINYKKNTMQFLRYGVERSEKQSLVACLADIYGKINKIPIPKIAEMRKIIADSVSLDDYKKYGKGSFVRLFSKKPSSKETLLKESYDNFRKYLLDKDSNIDHTYLWDIVSNEKLFENGLNMVIMEIVNNDITSKVDIICPLTSYVKNRFIMGRDTIFLINNGSRYEPVYLVKSSGNKAPKAFFKTTGENPSIRKLLETLDNTLNKYCNSSRKEIKEYTFDSPMEVDELIRQLNETSGYAIVKQVLNYQDRTIALFVENEETQNKFVIPCEPSEPQDFETEYMDNLDLWSDYKTTLKELLALKEKNKNILCKPVVKMMENGIVVGFLTETNQFIKIKNPGAHEVEDGEDELKPHILVNQKQNPYEIEMAIDRSISEDPERIRIVRNITLESSFFSLYRATIKSLLENREYRQEMISIIEDANSSYKEKLEKVKKNIHKITKGAVVFAKMPDSMLNKMLEISSTCKKNEKCGLYADGHTLNVPAENLISKKDNVTIYQYRVADEIVRYGRIQNFILNSNQFLNTGNADFKMNDDEFIISESRLESKEYFGDMINPDTNEYRAFNTNNGIPYDMAKTRLYTPMMVEKEKEEVEEKEVEEKEVEEKVVEKVVEKEEVEEKEDAVAEEKEKKEDDCIYQTKKFIKSSNGSNYWVKHVFPKKHFTESVVFKNNEPCSFEPLIYIMKQIKDEEYTIKQIKEMLWNGYSDYLTNPEYKRKIFELLDNQGKSTNKIIKKNYGNDLNLFIMSEEYYLTALDVWVFAQKYKLPIILFSSGDIINDFLYIQGNMPALTKDKDKYTVDTRETNKNTEFSYSWIILGGSKEDKFFFYSASSINRGGKERIQKNEMIIKPHINKTKPPVLEQFDKNDLGELKEQLETVFDRNNVFSLEDFLKARP